MSDNGGRYDSEDSEVCQRICQVSEEKNTALRDMQDQTGWPNVASKL